MAAETPNAPLMLSVSGLRGLIGQSLTPEVALRYAAAFGGWLRERQGAGGTAPHVVVGRDSRPSGEMVEHAAVAGLLAVGCRVTKLGIATTPTTAVLTEHLLAQGGLVITASHNPIMWNGIKCLRHDGVAPPAHEAQQIIDRYRAGRPEYVAVERLATVVTDHTADEVHIRRILDRVDVRAIQRRKPKVVLDSVHGAGGPATAALLKALGAELVHLYAEPTGRFPHTPEPTRENLTELAEQVRRHGADIGLAQDPDADRLAVVDEQGRYIGEEYTLALAADHVLRRHRGAGQAGKALSVAANLSTSRMLDDIAKRHGAAVHRTPVGEAHVAAAMRLHGSLVGGEGNGGIIWPVIGHVRDSLAGAALLLEMLALEGKPVSAAVAAIPAYAIVKTKHDVQPDVLARMADVLKKRYADQRVDLQDGVRIDWPQSWVHVRPSNTEPIIRVIAEAPDAAAAQRLIDDVGGALGLR